MSIAFQFQVSFQFTFHLDNMTLAKWLLEFLGIPRIFLVIPTQRTNDFPWKAVNLKNS